SWTEPIAPRNAKVKQSRRLTIRKGNPHGEVKPAVTADARRKRGLFGGTIPDVPRDGDVVSEEDLSIYAAALERNGFFGPSSWYMNHRANADYFKSVCNDGYLEMPVLFLNAQYDYVCECTHSRLPEPMRKYWRKSTQLTIRSGHWMAQEKPREVNAALAKWLATSLPSVWPRAS